jgi:hypothetical protein
MMTYSCTTKTAAAGKSRKFHGTILAEGASSQTRPGEALLLVVITLIDGCIRDGK